MAELIQEAVALALTPESRIDADAGLIRSVKVLGRQSRNRRRYPRETVARDHRVYEGAQVFLDHDYEQMKHGRPRPMGSWGGVIRGPREVQGEVVADLQYLGETSAGRIILEAARTCPDRFGLSPMHLIEVEKGADGWETVTAILECWSVDCVTRPATTRTLFEAEEKPMPDEPAVAPAPNGAAAPTMTIEEAFAALAGAIMADPALDDQTRVGYLKKLMALKKQVLGGAEEEAPAEGGEGEAPAPAEEAVSRPAPDDLAGRVAALEAEGRRAAVLRLVGESFKVDDQLMADLLAMPEDARARYVERLKDRRAPARAASGTPRSGTQRTAVSEAEARGDRPPLLTAGASREEVRRYWTGA
jgi:hypothetical protein